MSKIQKAISILRNYGLFHGGKIIYQKIKKTNMYKNDLYTFYKIDFKHINAGVLDIDKLGDLYSECDVALILSYTNLSLLPLELLASGCPVVINEGENNSWIDCDKKLFTYAHNTIDNTVEKLLQVLNGSIKMDKHYAEKFLKTTSWENEALRVKNILVKYLEEHHGCR